MGTFAIRCVTCNGLFIWWSGSNDQRCPNCAAKDALENTPPFRADVTDAQRKEAEVFLDIVEAKTGDKIEGYMREIAIQNHVELSKAIDQEIVDDVRLAKRDTRLTEEYVMDGVKIVDLIYPSRNREE